MTQAVKVKRGTGGKALRGLAVVLALCALHQVFPAGQGLRAQQRGVTVDVAGKAKVALVWVDGGTFTMGSDEPVKGVKVRYESTSPEHKVHVSGFYLSRFEVTQGLWRAVMGENPSKFQGNDSLPVESVSWEEAVQFTLLLSQMTGRRFRLPTEAEWEYAARGGAKGKATPYAGFERADLDRCCWYCVNGNGRTHPVGQLQPNELGLYDMSGNVAEWCADWVAEYAAGEQTDPQGPRDGESRVLRGGHYNSTSSACTVYDRGWYLPNAKYEFYGFRLVMEQPQEDE